MGLLPHTAFGFKPCAAKPLPSAETNYLCTQAAKGKTDMVSSCANAPTAASDGTYVRA